MKNPFITILSALLLVLISCHKSKSDEWTKANMTHLIQGKTDLKLPKNFKVLLDSVEQTEGALDSDYSYALTIEYNQLMEKEIVKQITNSILFDTIKTSNYADPIWDEINSKTEKGIWASKKNGFEFFHCDNDKNRAEPFYLTVDTLTNRIKLNLSHL
ncbi:hypothetical protein [Flavobacterium sp. ov086]|uniref:hypothetical protein n=1 Tax=Flavobacterium sp. ov086 TaxID=1761785 RepID=UPI000B6C95C8|nr:hypothetical protein [Flavobacterium sp. ov086]SNR42158.1 hypothetical protein SAMN04487979_105170 [Flavobacterium sp. ov086]